jgi:hypothetical protein
MSLIGTYSVTGATASTLSRYYSTVDDLLLGVPDNTNNQIQAINIRDAVYTLYEFIQGVAVVASASMTASVTYDRSLPSTYTSNVGGIVSGSTFSGTIQDALDRIFYPYNPPGAGLLSLSIREFGAPLSVNLNWTATKTNNNIISIIVDGTPQIPTGNSQTGVQSTLGTHSVSPSVSQTNTFSMSVNDGTSVVSASTNLVWMNRVYWGSIDLSSIGNPNLTLNPGSASLVSTLCTDSLIYSLTGAGYTPGSLLSTSKDLTYTNIDGAGEYLIFAWPSNVSGALSPTFNVNGLPNTAFTRVRTSSPFSNVYGFSGTNYEVWVSNTPQNSPLNIIIS